MIMMEAHMVPIKGVLQSANPSEPMDEESVDWEPIECETSTIRKRLTADN